MRYDTLGLPVSNLGRVSWGGPPGPALEAPWMMDGASTSDQIPSSELARLHIGTVDGTAGS